MPGMPGQATLPGVRGIAGGIAASAVALTAAALVLAFLDRGLVPASLTTWDTADISQMLVGAVTSVVGYVIASRRQENPIGWLALAAGALLCVSSFCHNYALRAVVRGARLAAGRSPCHVAVLADRLFRLVVPWVCAAPVPRRQAAESRMAPGRLGRHRYLRLVERDGDRGRHPGLCPSVRLALPGVHAGRAGVAALPAAHRPRAVRAGRHRPVRELRGEERLQLKWFALATAVLGVTVVVRMLADSAATTIAMDVAVICLEATVVLAVLKYRLYDIDIVISKALQYGALAAFITAVYAAVVVGVGAAVGDTRSVYLSAVAAAIVAVAFQPVRQRAALVANRLVYGRRATPYQVLSEFAHRIGGAYADDDVLPQMARMVAAGTGARRVVVWLVSARNCALARRRATPVLNWPRWSSTRTCCRRFPTRKLSCRSAIRGSCWGRWRSRCRVMSRCARPARSWGGRGRTGQPVLSNAGLISELRESRQRLVTAGTRRGGGWSATCTTGRSRTWWRWPSS